MADEKNESKKFAETMKSLDGQRNKDKLEEEKRELELDKEAIDGSSLSGKEKRKLDKKIEREEIREEKKEAKEHERDARREAKYEKRAEEKALKFEERQNRRNH